MSIYADFSATPLIVVEGYAVQFTDLSTVDGGDVITSWLWDFGDGDTSTEQNPLHVYDTDGFYNVSLTVDNIGVYWIPKTTPGGDWVAILHDGSQFVALSYSGSTSDIMTSPLGYVWTGRTTPLPSGSWSALAYGNGRHVATGYTNHSMVSTDGAVTWVRHDNALGQDCTGVAFGNNIFVAVSYLGDAFTSSDGINWVPVAVFPAGSWTKVFFVNDRFVAIQGGGSPSATIAYSFNGVDWFTVTLNEAVSDAGVAYKNGRYVITGGGVTNLIQYSDDFTIWVTINDGFNHQWYSITVGAGIFLACSSSGVASTRVMTSLDAITWVLGVTPTHQFEGVVFYNDRFVAVGDDGLPRQAMVSEFTETDTETKTNYIEVTSISDELDLDSIELFTRKPNWIENPKSTFDDNRELLQYAGTVTQLFNLGDDLRNTIDYKFSNLTKEGEYYLIDFFCRHKGKSKRFWLPYWKNTYKLINDISINDTIITIKDIRFSKVDQGYERFFIYTKDFKFITRKITTCIKFGDYEELYISTPMIQDITVDDILYFGKLFLVRFNTDILDMNYLSHLQSECNLSFIELPKEYSADESES